MRFIDPAIYASRRSLPELELMATAGLVAVIEPTTWFGTDRRYPETYFDDYERQLGPEARRAFQAGLGYGAALGVTPHEANNLALAQRVLEVLPRYLANERVVAIGEIGLERGTPAEEEIFRRQLRMARQYSMPVVIQVPMQDRREAISRALTIVSEEQVGAHSVLVNGVTEETLPLVRQFGAWYGLTIDRNTHVSAERAVQLLRQNGLEGAMIHSAAGRLHGDPLAVPKTARLMLDNGFTAQEVEKLTFHNPKWFFSQAHALPLPEAARQYAAAPRQEQPATAPGYAYNNQPYAGIR